MTRTVASLALFVVLGPLTAASVARAQSLIATEPVATGLASPVGVAFPPDGTGRIMIAEQFTGQVRVVKDGQLLPDPLVDVSDDLTASGEQGLLALAFHPRFLVNRRMFLVFNDAGGDLVLAEFLVPPGADVVDPTSATELLTIEKPFAQHNGGTLAFGPDGYLYWAVGDGGSGYDPEGHAQDLGSLLGKVLRLDVDGARPYAIPPSNPFVGVPGARGEVFAYGLRNPWRGAIDPSTGDLWLGDVGQEAVEELDLLPFGSGGQNFGWKCWEGSLDTGKCDESPIAQAPVYEYDHTVGCSVVGGPVYRGAAIPELQGHVFFSDYCTGQSWSFLHEAGQVTAFTERTSELGGFQGLISSWGQDGDGELYVVYYTAGEVHAVLPVAADPDCDADGTPDGDEFAAGTAFDANGNGTPDDCELLLEVSELVVGEVGTFDFYGAEPSQPVAFLYTERGIGPGPCFFGGALCLDLVPFLGGPVQGLGLVAVVPADLEGHAVLALVLPPIVFPDSIAFQAVALAGAESVKSNPVLEPLVFP